MFGLRVTLLSLVSAVPTVVDSHPDRTIGVQILNPHNMTITVMPAYDYRVRPIHGLHWLEDTPTFPGDRLVSASPNWQKYSDAVAFSPSTEAAHGVMNFRCEEMPTSYGSDGQKVARIDFRFSWGYSCTYGLPKCDSRPWYYNHRELCDDCAQKCLGFTQEEGVISMSIDCSKSTNATEVNQYILSDVSSLQFVESQSSDDWWTFEIDNLVDCSAECEPQCTPIGGPNAVAV